MVSHTKNSTTKMNRKQKQKRKHPSSLLHGLEDVFGHSFVILIAANPHEWLDRMTGFAGRRTLTRPHNRTTTEWRTRTTPRTPYAAHGLAAQRGTPCACLAWLAGEPCAARAPQRHAITEKTAFWAAANSNVNRKRSRPPE